MRGLGAKAIREKRGSKGKNASAKAAAKSKPSVARELQKKGAEKCKRRQDVAKLVAQAQAMKRAMETPRKATSQEELASPGMLASPGQLSSPGLEREWKATMAKHQLSLESLAQQLQQQQDRFANNQDEVTDRLEAARKQAQTLLAQAKTAAGRLVYVQAKAKPASRGKQAAAAKEGEAQGEAKAGPAADEEEKATGKDAAAGGGAGVHPLPTFKGPWGPQPES